MVNPDFNHDDATQTDLPIGEILRRARLHYKQTLEDVEQNIRIRASQIDAIERGDFEKIPGRTYAIGFVRSYSEYLGLDGEKMVRLFKTQYSGAKTTKPELNFPVAASEIRIASPWLIGACLVGAVLVMVVWWNWHSPDRSDVEAIPPVATNQLPASMTEPVHQEYFGPPEKNMQSAEAPPAHTAPTAKAADDPHGSSDETDAESDETPDATVATDAAPDAASTDAVSSDEAEANAPAQTASEDPVANKKATILNILQNSWVEIKDKSGKTLVSRVLQAGDRYFVPDNADLLMSLGNSGGIEIVIDGEKLKPLGEVGQVQRNISLDAASLKKNYGKKAR